MFNPIRSTLVPFNPIWSTCSISIFFSPFWTNWVLIDSSYRLPFQVKLKNSFYFLNLWVEKYEILLHLG